MLYKLVGKAPEFDIMAENALKLAVGQSVGPIAPADIKARQMCVATTVPHN